MKRFTVILLLLALFGCCSHAATVLHCARDMEHITVAEAEIGVPFRIVGTLTGFLISQTNLPSQLFFHDDSGTTVLSNNLQPAPRNIRPGDLVEASGVVSTKGRGIYAKLHALEFVRHQQPEHVRDVTIADLVSGRHDGRLVSTRGVVTGVFPDEIEPSYSYAILTDGPCALYAPIHIQSHRMKNADDLLGANVELTGWCCNSALTGAREHLGCCFTSAPDGIRIIHKPPYDPFDAPELDDCRRRAPAEICAIGPRRMSGEVLAAWRRNRFLLKCADGRLSCICTVKPELPPFGATVEVVGIPETDLYHINMSAARWRKLADPPASAPRAPRPVDARDILQMQNGRPSYNTGLHGQAICIDGIVRIVPQPEDPDGQLYVESNGMLVAADFSTVTQALPPLRPGCRVAVSGTCVFESENWRPNAIFPTIKKAVIVGRTPSDLRLVSNPPWWTPLRLLVVIVAMSTCIVAVVFWNRILNRRIEQRSRELLDEQIAHVSSDLKTMERTRLAIELHDSLSQNLTGVALQLQPSKEIILQDAEAASVHLEAADRALLSCREELRNCLRDLRSEALETADIDQAIRLTLSPHVSGTAVSIRFNVPRERISDSTLHAVLRIIRELVLNAIRHGHATSVRIAGAIEDDSLLFSVSDNGCGFNPCDRPGPREGHFGLEGIRERINSFNGKFKMDSKPGFGTKMTITLLLPKEEKSCAG